MIIFLVYLNMINITFTPENISKQWYILNYSNSMEEKRNANLYLTQFKQSDKAFEIAVQIFKLSNNQNDKIFSCIILYQIIKEHANHILKDKIFFENIKNIFFNDILQSITKQDNPILNNNLIIERICYCITIIMLLGLISYWENSINDILNFGKISDFQTYLTIIILSNCNNELDELNIGINKKFKMKSYLIEKKEEIKEFINVILMNSEKIDGKMYIKTVELAKNFITFELNILQMPQMTKTILKNINKSNIDLISNLFCESLNCAISAKLESNFSDIDISEFYSKTNNDEIISLSYLIDTIVDYIQNNNNNIDEDIINGLAKIFASISENFVFTFFTKNEKSQKLLQLFFYFIANKRRKISFKLFEGLSQIKIFINTYYKFSNFSDEEKREFSDYLINIAVSIMNNAKLKNPKMKNEILVDNDYLNLNEENDNETKGEDITIEENEISINDYRGYAEDTFFDIFEIFAKNFQNGGVNYFLSKISNSIIDLVNNDILNDNDLISIEIVIFVLKSIIPVFESLKLDTTPLIQFTSFLLNSKAINNNFVFVNFLLFIEQSNLYIVNDKKVYNELNDFLLNSLIKNDINNNRKKLISTIILGLSECLKENIPEIFNNIYKVYIEKYDNFDLEIVCNLCEALCMCFTNSDDEQTKTNIPFNTINDYYNKLCEPAKIRIKKTLEIIQNNNNIPIEKINLEILKNYQILEKVLKHCFFLNNMEFLSKFFIELFSVTYDDTIKIFEFYYNIPEEQKRNSNIISSITKIYIKSTKKIKHEYLLKIFPQLNELMLKSYSNSRDYHSIYVLKNIYSVILEHSNDINLKTEISNNFFVLIKTISQNILKYNQNQIETMDILAQFFTEIYKDIIITDNKNINNIEDTLNLFLDGLKVINENNLTNNIFRAFQTFISKTRNNELVNKHIGNLMKTSFSIISHFSSLTINQFTLFLMKCFKYDKINSLLQLKEIFETNNEFSEFTKEQKEIILKYIELKTDNQKELKMILNDLILISQGFGVIEDKILNYEIIISKEKNNKILN